MRMHNIPKLMEHNESGLRENFTELSATERNWRGLNLGN